MGYHQESEQTAPVAASSRAKLSVELTQPRRGGGGGGLGCAVPRCRHIGRVVEACLCFIVLVHLSCVTCVTCAGRATMTRRGGGGGGHRKVCRDTCRDMGKLL